MINLQKRKTKQMSIILDFVEKSKFHPTIKEIYSAVSNKIPKIGIATVYRNVSILVENKLIEKIQVTEKITRYDGNKTPHNHFICNNCNVIYDVFEEIKINTNVLKNKHEFKIDSKKINLFGICKKCQK